MTASSDIDVDVDVAICGAGPVGLALAALLVKRGMPVDRIVLLDAKPLVSDATSKASTSEDPRAIAVSYGSSQLLQGIDAWPIAANSIEEIHVSRRGYFGRTMIRCADFSLPALGYVTSYRKLVEALESVCTKQSLKVIQPVTVTALDVQQTHALLSLSNGQKLSAGIVVQAEGGQFFEQSPRARRHDYDQSAIVANVTTSAPMMCRAFERFTDEGPLALLPASIALSDRSSSKSSEIHYALVWCMRTDSAASLIRAPEKEFLGRLEQTFGSRLGRFLSTTARTAYPLGLNAGALNTSRSLAIGNAAQALHPVAGQGFNLGLRDATVLATLLSKNPSPQALTNFHIHQQRDRNTTIELTHLMARIFKTSKNTIAPVAIGNNLSQILLGTSLGLMDAISPAKRHLAHQMMFGSR